MSDPFSVPALGQMTVYERDLLRVVLLKEKPGIVIEAGTWYGGGSTYAVAQALRDNGRGHLWTVEIDEERSHVAFERYSTERPELLPFITFICGDSAPVIQCCPYPVDVFVCDGGDRLRDVLAMEPKMPAGGSMLFHDWHGAKEVTPRAHIEKSTTWSVEVVVDGLAWVKRV